MKYTTVLRSIGLLCLVTALGQNQDIRAMEMYEELRSCKLAEVDEYLYEIKEANKHAQLKIDQIEQALQSKKFQETHLAVFAAANTQFPFAESYKFSPTYHNYFNKKYRPYFNQMFKLLIGGITPSGEVIDLNGAIIQPNMLNTKILSESEINALTHKCNEFKKRIQAECAVLKSFKYEVTAQKIMLWLMDYVHVS